MTREEAIAIIRKEYLCVDRDCDIEKSCGKCDLMMPSKEPILQAYKMAIKALEQEPKTGHWIQTNEFFINQDGQFIYKFICSECKSLSYFRKSNKKAIGANVCPDCGCRMIEPQERSGEE